MNIWEYFKKIILGIRELFTEKKSYKREMFINQIYEYVALSVPMVFLVALLLGAVLTIQVIPELIKFGAETIAGGMVSLSLAREIAPIIVSIIIAGRMGSAMSAELGSMNITNQLDSLKLMAVDPIKYLGSPRVLASTIILPFLVLSTMFLGGVGSYLIAVKVYSIASGEFIEAVARLVHFYDVLSGLIKSIIFGFIIGFIACYKGLFLKGRSSEVGAATTDAVAFSIIAILFINLLLSLIIF